MYHSAVIFLVDRGIRRPEADARLWPFQRSAWPRQRIALDYVRRPLDYSYENERKPMTGE
jgi:hypothetical protein